MPVSASPLVQWQQSRVQAAKQVVTSWEDSPRDTAEFARDIDDVIVQAAVDWPQLVERTYHREWRRAVKGPINQCVQKGEVIFDLWDSCAQLLESIRRLGQSLVAKGQAVPHLSDLDAAIDKLNRNRSRVYDNWPWFRPEDEAEALAEHARGESLSLEEVFGALPRANH